MSDAASEGSLATRAGPPVFVGTIAVVVLAIIALLFFDLSLAAIDRRESAGHAADAYDRGVNLLQSRNPAAAADEFRIAVGLNRTSINYSLGLAEATLEAGHAADAESTLKVLLTRSENDGAVNLTMAHVMLRQGRVPEAKAYFHRAIFGRWGEDSVVRRRQARFELIDLLAARGAPSELLAELLPFEDVSPDSSALRLRLGRLFLLAGSPIRAANMFRGLVRRDPNNAEALAGMGEAALALGNFRTARSDLAAAAEGRPDDARIRERLELVDSVVALNPSASGLHPDERYARSRLLLSRTLDALARCGDPTRSAASPASAFLLARPAPPDSMTMAGEAMVGAAVELWNARSNQCDLAIRDRPLRTLLGYLAQ